MLLMTAFEVGNPIEVLILVKSHNFTGDSGRACSHGFHMEPTGRGVNECTPGLATKQCRLAGSADAHEDIDATFFF